MRHCAAVGIFLIGIAAFGFAKSAPTPRPSSPLEQTLMTAEKSYLDAAKKGDSDFLKRTLADDFSYVGTDGQFNERQQFIDDLGDGEDILAYNLRVVSVSEGVGIVSYDVVVRSASDDDNPEPRYQHFSTVWVKTGDAWKMKFHQRSVSHWGDW
jgi:hypothetical protein